MPVAVVSSIGFDVTLMPALLIIAVVVIVALQECIDFGDDASMIVVAVAPGTTCFTWISTNECRFCRYSDPGSAKKSTRKSGTGDVLVFVFVVDGVYWPVQLFVKFIVGCDNVNLQGFACMCNDRMEADSWISACMRNASV